MLLLNHCRRQPFVMSVWKGRIAAKCSFAAIASQGNTVARNVRQESGLVTRVNAEIAVEEESQWEKSLYDTARASELHALIYLKSTRESEM